ncbi:MAG: hypothetical protein E7321_00690 [Clostridiales bacterium]|nr:hypothetical protein [Clostridiales bacterium]
MKEFFANVMRGFVCALAAAAFGALSIALMLALYDIPREVDMAVLLWGGVLLVLSVVCEILARRDVSMLAYLIAGSAILFFGGEQVVSRTVFMPASSGFPIFLRLCIWTSGAVCAQACRKEPGSDVFVRLSDMLILAIGGFMATLYGMGEPMNMPILALALGALLLSMLVTASLRAGGESDSVIRGTGMGGYLVIGALLGICLLLAALLLYTSSGHVDSIVDLFLVFWAHFSRIAMALMTGFGLLLAFLFGGQRMMERNTVMQEDGPDFYSGVMEEMSAAPQWVVYLVMGVIAAAILAAVIAVLWALRHTKLGRSRKKKKHRKVTRTSHAGAAIRALIGRIVHAVAFELRYRANRRTPQGLYILAVRTCRVKRIPRRKHESPGAYMRRLHIMLTAQGSVSSLDQLAQMLDHALYGGLQTQLSRREADAFAAQIRSIAAPPLVRTEKSE